MSSEADKDRLLWSEIFAIRTLHKATLQELLGTRNYAAMQLLSERNDLLRERYLALGLFFCDAPIYHLLSLFCQWREFLSGPSIKYSDKDFITPSNPDALLPYIITQSGAIVPLRSGQPSGGHHPGVARVFCYVRGYETYVCTLQGLLRQMTDASTQTKDPDSTLTNIEPPIFDEEVVPIKKRKRCD